MVMGRGRSTTNYNDTEKRLLLKAIATVKPYKPACWQRIADYYNANHCRDATVDRDADSLKRKFKTMVVKRKTRFGDFEDPFMRYSRHLMQQMKDRATAASNGEYDPDQDTGEADGEDAEQFENNTFHPTEGTMTPTAQLPVGDEQQYLPSLGPLLPGQPPTRGPSGHGSRGSDLAQVLLVIREENAQREATRRAEREESLAREERLREEALALRRHEREDAAAREDRYWHEMAEQRRRDREESAARHEQMMAILGALLKPTAAAAADTMASMRAGRHL